MRRLLNNIPIRVFFEEGGEGSGGKGGENMVPQSRVNEMTAKHEKAVSDLTTKLTALEAQLKEHGDKKLAEDGKLKELLESRDKELTELKGQLEGLKAIETKYHADLTTRWKDELEGLTKSHPDQTKKLQEMSAFRKGDTPQDAEANLSLVRDLRKAEFFGTPDGKLDTDKRRTGGQGVFGLPDGYRNPASRLGQARK